MKPEKLIDDICKAFAVPKEMIAPEETIYAESVRRYNFYWGNFAERMEKIFGREKK